MTESILEAEQDAKNCGARTWVVDLDSEFEPIDLPENEQHDAAKFADRILQKRFVARRRATRLILEKVTGASGQKIEIVRPPMGKPYVLGRPIEFSVSSSQRFAVVAVATVPVGIDIEFIDADFDFLPMLDGRFPETRVQLSSDHPENSVVVFFGEWTRFEARRKLHGKGLEAQVCEDGTTTHEVRAPKGFVSHFAVQTS